MIPLSICFVLRPRRIGPLPTPGRLVDAASRLTRWAEVPDAAEAHGLAPLLYRHLSDAGAPLPMETRQQLFASNVRHRDANQYRFEILGQILEAFEREDIRVVVLKGAALAHLLYESPGLRPFGDLDLLVEPQAAWRAQSVLGSLGFVAAQSAPTDRRLFSASSSAPRHQAGRRAHHPGGDPHERFVARHAGLAHARGYSPARRGVSTSPAARRLRSDMWTCCTHLCRHVAERASLLRLIWVADIVWYAARYASEISWGGAGAPPAVRHQRVVALAPGDAAARAGSRACCSGGWRRDARRWRSLPAARGDHQPRSSCCGDRR